MKKIQNAVAHALRRGLEDGLAAHRERILIQTEFKRFSYLPDEIIQRCWLQLDFENILSKKLGKEISIQLNDWCWKEHFDKISLLQVYLFFLNFIGVAKCKTDVSEYINLDLPQRRVFACYYDGIWRSFRTEIYKPL